MTDTEIKTERRREFRPLRAVRLLGIGTAVPPPLTQREAAQLAEGFACDSDGQRMWLRRVFSRSGVEQRGSVLAEGGRGLAGVEAFYGPPAVAGVRGPSTSVRMERYAQQAPPLMERAARAALAEAGIQAGEVTHVITASCTGFFAPGLDVELITRLGLRRDVRRTHIGFMGCHAAFNALATARDAVGADADAIVLVCCVELSTLHFAYGWNPEKLVANALFADGAGSCVLGGCEREPEIDLHNGESPSESKEWKLVETASMLLPESREAMTWKIGDNGFEMTLSAALPELIGKHVRGWCETWLRKVGLEIGDIERWAIHPGGPKILASARDALGLSIEQMRASESVLAQHGNMSSASVLFILKELLGEASEGDRCVAIGFGPGLMAEGMLLVR